MLNKEINNEGIVFSSKENGEEIDFDKWSDTDACIYYLPLATLVDNGFASLLGKKCIVPFESIYQIAQDDRDILGIPCLYNQAMRLRAEGTLNRSDFKYKIELLTHVPDGEMIPFERFGNIINSNSCEYLLSLDQYELIKRVDEFNQTSEKKFDSNLIAFAEIKRYALKANCYLDSYLENENVVIPERVKLEIEQKDSEYEISPSIDIEEKDKFTSVFKHMRKIRDVIPVPKRDGARIRVVLNEKQRNELWLLKSDQIDVRKIVESPTEYFDPEQFDLSEFYSDRVIDIGVYKPKFYPFISPYKSCWIVGAMVETPGSGTSKLILNSIDSICELEKRIEEGRKNGETTLSYRNVLFDIDDAQALVDMAKKQINQPDKPLNIRKDQNDNKVLIIEENTLQLDFSESESQVRRESHYILSVDQYLKKEFSLKAHQEEGVAWLQYLFEQQASGCLMADDMGLGKTLQVLYFIDWHSRIHKHHNPYLIVAPVSLLENWENEYSRFFNDPMRICRLTSVDVPRQFNKGIVAKMQKMDIILTNYESLRISQLNFCAVNFDIVVLDEAQKIKTPGTLVTNAAKALNAHFKIAMTGTPVENTLLDLWCIMDFCVPGLLDNAKSFASIYQTPLKKEDTDIEMLGREIHQRLGIYFMRRVKSDVAKDLPEKHEIKKEVDMPLGQESLYCSVVNDYQAKKLPNMLLAILKLKEISEHPFLYESALNDVHSSRDLIESSARLQATIKFLDGIKAKGEKVIVFAERKEIQKMLQRIFKDRYGLIAKIINGDTPSIGMRQYGQKLSRQAAIDSFQSADGFNIIIMSPIAAGMGLNVTKANHVIHYSRHWNPAKESQATDRAYRIGQEKDVYVYYPMATSKNFTSFDVTLDNLLGRKSSLAASTIFPTERIEVRQEELGKMLFDV